MAQTKLTQHFGGHKPVKYDYIIQIQDKRLR